MGKSHKKKQKTADFQKVKLKVGKRKPVGTNVTNTTFKTSSINITSQLEEKNEPTNKRNLSLKELLVHLNHYNVTMRHEALLGIKDLFQKHPQVMHTEINIWISKVLEKIVDTDPAVRHSLHLCLNFALNELTETEVKPFLKVIVAHICCGMTHINESVQLDTLNILEILIDRFTTVIVPYIQKILTNFMDLISKQTSRGTKSSQTVKGSKVKSVSNFVRREVNFDSGNLSSLKTQCKILEKLYKILLVVKEFHSTSKKSNKTSMAKSKRIFQINSAEQIFIPFTKRCKEGCNDNTSFEEWLNDDNNKQNAIMEDFDGFIETIFQVLINVWVEHEPGQLATGILDSKAINSVLPGMIVIVRIIEMMIELVTREYKQKNEKLLLSEYTLYKDFSVHFLHYFVLPIDFAKSLSSFKGIAQDKANKIQQFAIDFNFTSANVVLNFFNNIDFKNSTSNNIDTKFVQTNVKKMQNFIILTLENSSLLNLEKINKFINMVHSIIQLRLTIGTSAALNEVEAVIDLPVIIEKMVYTYIKASVTSPWKIPLIKFFDQLINLNHQLLQERTWSKVNNFIVNLISNIWSIPPSSSDLIKESISFIKMVLVRNVADKKHETMIESSIIKMIDGHNGCLFIEVSKDIQKMILEIVYNVHTLSDQMIKKFTRICQKSSVSNDVKKYCISILSYSVSKDNPSLGLEMYISFILSVVIGYSVDELKKFNASPDNNVISWSMLNIFQDKKKDLPIDYAMNGLKQFNDYKDLWCIIVPCIGRLLVMLRSLPVTTAVGLIKLLERLSNWRVEFPDETLFTLDSEINQIADLLSSVLLFSVSKTYKCLIGGEKSRDKKHDDQLEDDVICICIKLLVNNPMVLRHLVKKWINVLGEYKMNWTCVSSIIEVIVALLYDSQLQMKMVSFKPNLQSIVHAFNNSNVPVDQKYLLRELEIQVSML